MTRKIMLLGAAVLALPALAQDIYKVENFAGEDLNGTARFVGMGGAMSALGADLSTIGSNPAGIGLFRRSDMALTGSVTAQPDAETMDDIGRSRVSFDQMGAVFSTKINGESLKFINFAVNYQKRRNMKNYIGLQGIPTANGLSQSWQMADLASFYGQWNDGSEDWQSPLAHVGWNSYMVDVDANGNFIGSDAERYNLQRVQYGGIQQYDFNVALNLEDRWYLGLTVGAYNVNWHALTDYSEIISDGVGGYEPYTFRNDEQISGTGLDVKFGFIGRPVEESPFRFGLTVQTPTWYDLTGNNVLRVHSPWATDGSSDGSWSEISTGDFDYRITTPWKFGLSMATTVGNVLALDAEYEYKDYTGASVRYPTDDSYYHEGMINNTSKDRSLAYEIDHGLRGVSTFRIGAEARVAPGTFLRLGYNYVSSPFKDDAIRNMYWGDNLPNNNLDDMSIYNTTGTEYVNLGAINRFTAGIGYHGKHFYIDFAYQFQKQQGDVYAFYVPQNAQNLQNMLQKQTLDFNRHNASITLGYKF